MLLWISTTKWQVCVSPVDVQALRERTYPLVFICFLYRLSRSAASLALVTHPPINPLKISPVINPMQQLVKQMVKADGRPHWSTWGFFASKVSACCSISFPASGQTSMSICRRFNPANYRPGWLWNYYVIMWNSRFPSRRQMTVKIDSYVVPWLTLCLWWP